jgi:hypothetical protein
VNRRLAPAVAAVAALTMSSAAAAAPPPARQALTIVRSFAALPQRADGNVVDPATHQGAAVYGQAMLAEAALGAWRRYGDEAALALGERMLGWVATHRAAPRPSPFELGAAAQAYRMLPRSSPVREQLRRWLLGYPVEALGRLRYTSNHSVVRADGLWALCRLGLRPDSQRLCRMSRRLVDRSMGAAMRPFTRRGVAVFSDPPRAYPAYHQLVMGYLAHVVRARGLVRGRPVRMLLAMARGTRALAAPDGDLAYWGRCQEESWAWPLAAYGLRVAARVDRDRGEAAAFRALAGRLLGRLARTSYGGPYGIWIVPAMTPAPFSQPAGVEGYVSVTNYAALTAVALSWLGARPPSAGPRPPRAAGIAFAAGRDAFATARRRGVWFAVRERGARAGHGDLRSDFGLVALEHRVGGRWQRLLWLRPRTPGPLDSAGPVLTTHGRTGYPEGTRIARAGAGTVVVRGGWRDRRGRWLRRATFRFSVVRGGVRLTFRVRRGDRIAYSVFAPLARSDGAAVVDGRARTRISLPSRLSLRAGYASAETSALTRATLAGTARRAGRVTVVVRAA